MTRAPGGPLVSIVVIAHDMARELPRTLASLSSSMQQGIDDIPYEIVVVDNGSDAPVAVTDPLASVIRVQDATPSPARAVNLGIAACAGDLIGVFIDGARLASPGIIRHAVLATRIHARPIISTLGFHLGPDIQTTSIMEGYDQAAEDALLAASAWELDGYRLFDISVFAGSSKNGWFMPIAESNALFMRRAMWAELGGYEERFLSPGGGLVNLDTYERACSLPDAQVITLIGEGTFHQVHGGVATNALVSPMEGFQQEYEAIRGRPFRPARPDTVYLGRVRPELAATLSASAARLGRA